MEEAMVRQHQTPFLALQYEVWQYGPVAKEIFVGFSNTPTILREYVYTSSSDDGTYILPNNEFDPQVFTEDELSVMASVVKTYGALKARELKDITHRPDSLWYKKAKSTGLLDAFERQECTSSDEVIDFAELLSADLRPLYQQRLHEVEAVNDLKISFQNYQLYQRVWDGEDALPLTKQVKDNFLQVLSIAEKSSLANIRIFPEDNGALSIEAINRQAGISLGNDAYSYYTIIDGHVAGEDNLQFSAESVSKLLSSFL
jgi:uncharacterized phage-associated protein